MPITDIPLYGFSFLLGAVVASRYCEVRLRHRERRVAGARAELQAMRQELRRLSVTKLDARPKVVAGRQENRPTSR